MTTRGLKRLCGACGTKYYDFGKLPIKCPSCGVEFTGEVVVKTRRKSSIVADTVKRDAIEKKNAAAVEDDEDTISLDDLDEGDDDDLDDDLDIDLDDDDDDIDGDDDLSDLEGDVNLGVDLDDDK